MTSRDLEQALEIINDLYSDEECSFDHHGYCQAHLWFSTKECPDARAKRFLEDHSDRS